MTSESKKSSEVGGGGKRRSEITAEVSLSEVEANGDENHRKVAEVQYTIASAYALDATSAFDEAEVGDKVPARGLHRPRIPTSGENRQLTAAEAFTRDRGTVRALSLTQLAAGERFSVDAWLDKLDGCGDPEVRSQYAEFLIRTVAGGNMRVEPFWGRPPPAGPLGLQFTDPALLHSGPPSTRPDSALQPQTPITRKTFYSRQPIPEDGTFCYAAAFSDMS